MRFTRYKSPSKKMDEVRKADQNIHILINNAGFGLIGLHEELDYTKLEEIIQVNLTAPILITRILLRQIKQNKGIIINISSITAKNLLLLHLPILRLKLV